MFKNITDSSKSPPPPSPPSTAASSPEFNVTASCGTIGLEEFAAIQSCGFWVEGVALTAIGCLALVTNFVSIYGFTRKELRNSFNYLIVALTVVDSFFVVFVMAEYRYVDRQTATLITGSYC